MYHNQDSQAVLDSLQVDVNSGLTLENAQKNLQKYGYNKLVDRKKATLYSRFLAQFKDVMIVILLLAALVSFAVTVYEKSGEYFEPILIVLIILINATIGVLQENKAERALESLKSLSAPHARVLRDGKEQIIEAHFLVPGDIIMLQAGDFVPADARLIEAAGLKSDESALTGESVPAEKDIATINKQNLAVGDMHNMVFSGCAITQGRAKAVVTQTGMNTQIGNIANLLGGEKSSATPLQQKLTKLGGYLGGFALLACAIVFAVGLINKMPVMSIFMIAVSLAVSAIPEGLPAIVTIILSIGVTRMTAKNAIIKRLPAVETLGSASVICSDKTGTLTQNRMTLTKLYTSGANAATTFNLNLQGDELDLIKNATLCCDGQVYSENGIYKFIGDPTETAIIFAAYKNGLQKNQLDYEFERVAELPFDSDRKLMSVVCKYGDKYLVIVKGAFDELIKKCKNSSDLAKQINTAMSGDALRVIAVAQKVITTLPKQITAQSLESDLTFLGLVGLIDPPRFEAKRAVEICKQAGIKTVMITGDHIVTASAIAKELGILNEGEMAITGAQLKEMSDKELSLSVEQISVYARVSPEDKIKIVKAWQSNGKIVAMTGDGVNDAPALKAADIGCAMGITGTDVAKDAADITLTDDNFATIVDAIKEGRGIFDNIKKVVGFLIGTNIGEILSVFVAMLIWGVSPFISIQLLWINLATDSLPAIALGMEKTEEDVMVRPPRPKNQGIFAHGYGYRLLLQGLLFGAITLLGYGIGNAEIGHKGGSTMAFIVLACSQIVQAYNMRSQKSLFSKNPFSNKFLNAAVAISIALICLIVFIPPVAIAFGFTMLSAKYYFIALSFAFIPVVFMETAKALKFGKI